MWLNAQLKQTENRLDVRKRRLIDSASIGNYSSSYPMWPAK